ncbi:hypothetical protein EAF04_002448 [Stromatinia cepivora]|nr:hypothetical protein EAF04_002448 [Stromatinia cepivora]
MTEDQRSKDPAEFPLFSSFPVEIQCQIYKESFLKPNLVGWKFYIFNMGEGNSEIEPLSKERQDVLSLLLLACKNSKDEVFRNYEKLEFNLPISVELRSRNGIDTCVYIRPTVDTVVLFVPKLLELYELGGSTNLENITHLVLSNLYFQFWGGHEDEFADDVMMQHQAKVYTMISTHCPALKRFDLQFAACFGTFTELSNCWTIIDISEGCVDLDWNIERWKRLLLQDVTQPSERDNAYVHNILEEKMYNIQLVNNDANKILRDFHRFLNTKDDDAWDMPGKGH